MANNRYNLKTIDIIQSDNGLYRLFVNSNLGGEFPLLVLISELSIDMAEGSRPIFGNVPSEVERLIEVFALQLPNK